MLAALLGFSWLAIDSKQLALWAFAALVGAMFALIVDRTGARKWPGALAIAVFFTAWVTAHWVVVMSTTATYPDQLTVPNLFATAVAIVAAWRRNRVQDDGPIEWWQTDHAGTVAAAAIAFLAALNGLDSGAAATPLPFFLLVGLDASSCLLSPSRPVGRAGAGRSGRVVGVQRDLACQPFRGRHRLRRPRRLHRDVSGLFLAWPFAAARWLAPWLKSRPAPWLASALVGPATFPLYYDAWRDSSARARRHLPVTMAAVSVMALYGVAREFAPSVEGADAKRRLNYLALFAAIALGFVATAVPLQLERQWITIGWAIEAAAVWWLFGLLPHPGLKYLRVGPFSGRGGPPARKS